MGDDGAAAIAEVLRLGGADVKIAFLELLDDNIGPKVNHYVHVYHMKCLFYDWSLVWVCRALLR